MCANGSVDIYGQCGANLIFDLTLKECVKSKKAQNYRYNTPYPPVQDICDETSTNYVFEEIADVSDYNVVLYFFANKIKTLVYILGCFFCVFWLSAKRYLAFMIALNLWLLKSYVNLLCATKKATNINWV